MAWEVVFHDAFHAEFLALPENTQDQMTSVLVALRAFGPRLSRPQTDTLKGSRFANMKELRVSARAGEWRIAYAFDPARRAILLVAGDKSGMSGDLFYRRLIRVADKRFEQHLQRLEK
jgi:hypothetical protein